MVASLVPTEGGSPITLDKPIMLIGRHQECDIALQMSSKISRRHCCVAQCGERYVVRDLGSMNGIRVNGNRVIESDLTPGDEVSVADVVFLFRRDDIVSQSSSRSQQRAPSASPPGEVMLPPVAHDGSSDLPVAIPEEPDEHDVQPFGDEAAIDSEVEEVRLKDGSQSESDFVRA